MGDRVAGKVAIITGGASGIRRACAERLAGEGAAVVVTDIRVDEHPSSSPTTATASTSTVSILSIANHLGWNSMKIISPHLHAGSCFRFHSDSATTVEHSCRRHP